METFFFLYHSKSVIKVLVILNKYKHICVICRKTGSLATDNVPSRTEYSIAEHQSCWYSQLGSEQVFPNWENCAH